MKILKIAGLLFVVCFINTIHSMEPLYDEFPVERQLLQGKMSPESYLIYISKLSLEGRISSHSYNDLAYKISMIRTKQRIYYGLLATLGRNTIAAQQTLADGDQEHYEEIVRDTQEYIVDAIDSAYDYFRGG